MKIELPLPKPGPQQTARSQCDDQQRNHGLPVCLHALNIGGLPAQAKNFSTPPQRAVSAATSRELRLSSGVTPAYAASVSNQRFVHPYRVTYRDCTLGNHVYYANYLGILEAARGEFFRCLGSTLLRWQETGFMFPVVEAQLRYKALARYDDTLSIEVWVSTAERVRLNFGYRITNQSGALVLEGETLHVCMSLGEKLQRLPEELITAVRPHLRASTA